MMTLFIIRIIIYSNHNLPSLGNAEQEQFPLSTYMYMHFGFVTLLVVKFSSEGNRRKVIE